MKTTATVVEVNGTRATVETERVAACEGCHKAADGKTCSVCSLMGGNSRKFRSVAENAACAVVGDRVTVETSSRRVLFYAALVFLMPVLVAAIGGVLGWVFTSRTVPTAIGAAIGFSLAFLGVRIYSVRIGKRRPDAVITEVIGKARPEDSDHSPENAD